MSKRYNFHTQQKFFCIIHYFWSFHLSLVNQNFLEGTLCQRAFLRVVSMVCIVEMDYLKEISFKIFLVRKINIKLLYTIYCILTSINLPLLVINHFSKFHLTSFPYLGSYIRFFVVFILSSGGGHASYNNNLN